MSPEPSISIHDTDWRASTLPICLTIAGSDSGGGAGIQADLKTFQANSVFGISVLTAVTAQNTRGVTLAEDLSLAIVRAQLQAVFDDFSIAAMKTGMLSSAEIVTEVARFVASAAQRPPLVVDPVMIAKSGHSLLAPEAVETIRTKLLPLAELVTPNRLEAELLAGMPLQNQAAIDEAAARILGLGPKAVLIKGGHFEGNEAIDLLYEPGSREPAHRYRAPRIESSNTHGTGCTFSAAICAWIARGFPLPDAIAHAKHYVTEAIRYGLAIGHGHGPTHHFYFLRGDETDFGSRNRPIPGEPR
jgi:hydroxymethylpyrimidine/phosphomethylpyrimidine kinase